MRSSISGGDIFIIHTRQMVKCLKSAVCFCEYKYLVTRIKMPPDKELQGQSFGGNWIKITVTGGGGIRL